MTSIVIETQLEPRDWRALSTYLHRNSSSSNLLLQGYTPYVLVVTAVTLCVGVLFRLTGNRADPATAFWAIALSLISMAVLQRFYARRWQPDNDGTVLGPLRLEIDATGIRSTRNGQSGFTDWSRVRGIDETADHFFLPLDRIAALLIPKRSLDPDSTAELAEQLRRWRTQRASPAAPDAAPAHPWPSPAGESGEGNASEGASQESTFEQLRAARPMRTGFWWQVCRNLQAGLALFGLRRTLPTAFTSSFDHVIVLLAITLLVAVGFDWLRSEPSAEFGFYGFYAWAYYLLGGFWACALVARLQGPQANTRALLVALLSLAPYLLAAFWLLSRLWFADTHPLLVAGMMAGLLAGMSLRAVRAVFGYVRPGTLALVVLAVLGLPSFLNRLGIDTDLWVGPDTADTTDPNGGEDGSAAESILFNEPDRIAAAVEATAPQRPGVTDMYFVGFAGYGEQRVFRREALFGAKTFAARLGTGERTVELINDVSDRETYPLASVSGLRYALQLIGDRMDRDNDVLVLLLTSHGSREEGISVTNGRLPLENLSPAQLRDALDDSGIKWRVIIVSACYAGVFLDPLKSDTTLVMTAADAEHSSFGCADDRDLTYFGEALLRDALPKTPSLEAAFLTARDLIDQRENAEKLTHSNPQIYIGSAIRPKLLQSHP